MVGGKVLEEVLVWRLSLGAGLDSLEGAVVVVELALLVEEVVLDHVEALEILVALEMVGVGWGLLEVVVVTSMEEVASPSNLALPCSLVGNPRTRDVSSLNVGEQVLAPRLQP